MIATFTPMLYKHVADRRADIENINRANTLLYLQHKAEDYLKDPDNITALVTELGHNQHKEIYPSEMGAGSNFDGRYIVGIRREDENNKPVLKAMIIDTVHTGSDLRAAKVAELIGISAGIYTAVDPDAAWGINGIWSEPLSRYFDTTDIPTGAVAITTEYNKAKYRVNISDILVDADLDMGEFEVTAEQINAVNIAAENGTLDQLIAQNVNATTEVTSPKVSATERFCFKKENGTEDCIESWEGLGGGNNALTEYQLIINCNTGDESACQIAYVNNLNRTCSSIKDIFTRAGFGNSEGANPVYSLTYGTGNTYQGYVRTQCGGTQFVVSDISTATLTNPVEQVGDSAFAITQPGWYQITLMGEAGWSSGDTDVGSGGILIANKNFSADALLILKSVQGGVYSSASFGGAGVLLWDDIITTNPPTLGAGGGRGNCSSGGGIVGGSTNVSSFLNGYGWNGTRGGNTTACSDTACGSADSSGGAWYSGGNYAYGGSGSSQSECSTAGYSSCITIMGGNATNSGSPYVSYLNSAYGNWGTNALTGGKGYASIAYCGESESDCPVACYSDEDCSGSTPYCDYSKGRCSTTRACASSSDCPGSIPYCVSGVCSATCTADSQCPSGTPYCNSGTCDFTKAGAVVYSKSTSSASIGVSVLGTVTLHAGKYKFDIKGGGSKTGGDGGGGILTGRRTFNNSITFEIRSIGGWQKGAYPGVGLFYNGSVQILAGGGCYFYTKNSMGGGGYAGGMSGIGNSNSGASFDGTRGSSTAHSGAGTGGGCSASDGGYYGFGGTGYCASAYSCTGTYGGNSGVGSAVITYCGPSADSVCPAD